MGNQTTRFVAVAGIRWSIMVLGAVWLLPRSPAMAGEGPRTAEGSTQGDSPVFAARESGQSPGIAARYPGDRGIGKDPAVIFADDFESWSENGTQPPPGAGWSVRKNNISRTRVVPGKVAMADGTGPGKGVLEIACWTQGTGSQAGGLSRKLGNYNHANERLGDGYDEIYVRYYLKFDENYYHGLPKEYDAAHPIQVYFDNLVMARQYVGPMQSQGR
jgi:hypothetical protein